MQDTELYFRRAMLWATGDIILNENPERLPLGNFYRLYKDDSKLPLLQLDFSAYYGFGGKKIQKCSIKFTEFNPVKRTNIKYKCQNN